MLCSKPILDVVKCFDFRPQHNWHQNTPQKICSLDFVTQLYLHQHLDDFISAAVQAASIGPGTNAESFHDVISCLDMRIVFLDSSQQDRHLHSKIHGKRTIPFTKL